MAEVYKWLRGYPVRKGDDPVAWVVARHVEVQGALMGAAMGRAAIAAGVLAAHKDSGAAQIVVEHGDVDWYVILKDKPDKHGAMNAMAIEIGASRGRGGVRALTTAFPESNLKNIVSLRA